MPRVRQLIAGAENVILESNSVLRFLRPDVSLSVLDPGVSDFKESALRYLDRVDAVVVPESGLQVAAWSGVSLKLVEGKPKFVMRPPEYCAAELVEFVRERVLSRELQET